MNYELENASFYELTPNEEFVVNGGGPVAAVYALGFAMHMAPAAALGVVGVALIAGVAVGYWVYSSNRNKKKK
jgi:hypothetical protein